MFSFSFWGVGSEGVLIGFFVVLKMRIDREDVEEDAQKRYGERALLGRPSEVRYVLGLALKPVHTS